MKEFGIDISRWNGEFDLERAKKEGVKFVIIKGGGGDDGLYTDSKFTANYKKAKKIGLKVGCYWFSRALTVEQAKKEAQYFYKNVLKGRKLELPVYIDVENKTQLAVGKEKLTKIVKTWCEYLENKKYYVGIYSSLSYFKTYMNDAKLADYAHWIASWSTSCSYKPSECFGLWQFGGETNYLRSNKVAGKVCDQDYLLIDYTKTIKKHKLNGFD